MQRREFITFLGGAAATWPFAVHAQQPTMPVVGFIHILSPENVPHFVPAFQQGLKEAGFVEGQNVSVEYRWAHGQYDRMPELAADLVSRQVAVIAALGGEPSPQIVEKATRTIPIVFASNGDPVSEGLVASLNRPGGNATGVTIFGTAAVAKRMQLLKEVAPQATVIGFLMNPTNPNGNSEMNAAQSAASSLGKELLVLRASSESEIDTAFASLVQLRAGALVVGADPFLSSRREQLRPPHRSPATMSLPQPEPRARHGNRRRAGVEDLLRVAEIHDELEELVGRLRRAPLPFSSGPT